MGDLFIDGLLLFILVVVVAMYFYIFIVSIKKTDKKRKILKIFHNSILSIAENNGFNNFDDAFKQLDLNYNKLCQEMRQDTFKSVLDLLETTVYYYDTYTPAQFENLFNVKKDNNIRASIVKMSLELKEKDPFVSAPKKESDLMKMIKKALENSDISSGENFLKQLSSEIEYKERILEKKEKDNQTAIIVSIVGIILTIFFGLLSFVRF